MLDFILDIKATDSFCYCRWPCLGTRVVIDSVERSLPTLTILGFWYWDTRINCSSNNRDKEFVLKSVFPGIKWPSNRCFHSWRHTEEL